MPLHVYINLHDSATHEHNAMHTILNLPQTGLVLHYYLLLLEELRVQSITYT
jgi:hypothetical protein